MSNERKRNIRIIYDDDMGDSVLGPYPTLEAAEDAASQMLMMAHVEEILIELV